MRRRRLFLAAAASALALVACWDFSFVPVEDGLEASIPDTGAPDRKISSSDAEGEQDAADAAETGPVKCVEGGKYCGGGLVAGKTDFLYRCLGDGSGAVDSKCANGCFAENPQVGNDKCRPPTPCQGVGFYCGGDKVNGPPDDLFRCQDGKGVFDHTCLNGCMVAPPGNDDYCK